jgi:hypothetical protein
MPRLGEVEERDTEALLHQQKERISSHESLLHTMYSAIANSAARMLERLRSGAYDGVPRSEGSGTFTGDANPLKYPWQRELRLS